MRRTDRARSWDFSMAVIDRCTHGVMALSTGENTPYCLPVSFVRTGDVLYFHCAREGRKVHLLRQFPQVCITFVGEDRPAFVPPSMYTTYYQSAIVTGTASEVTDPAEQTQALRALCQKLTPEHMDSFEAAVEKSLSVTAVWRIHMDEVTGKAKLEH
ncbi:MAG: pyridoxamine 5'-phosphate oxidase family protein [Lawsonibacter sp.]|nr:pyridoxamine 5'-phosphate oxidase family protein [Lawsonibacter sp.]